MNHVNAKRGTCKGPQKNQPNKKTWDCENEKKFQNKNNNRHKWEGPAKGPKENVFKVEKGIHDSFVYSFIFHLCSQPCPKEQVIHLQEVADTKERNLRKRRPQRKNLSSLLLMFMAWALFATSCWSIGVGEIAQHGKSVSFPGQWATLFPQCPRTFSCYLAVVQQAITQPTPKGICYDCLLSNSSKHQSHTMWNAGLFKTLAHGQCWQKKKCLFFAHMTGHTLCHAMGYCLRLWVIWMTWKLSGRKSLQLIPNFFKPWRLFERQSPVHATCSACW